MQRPVPHVSSSSSLSSLKNLKISDKQDAEFQCKLCEQSRIYKSSVQFMSHLSSSHASVEGGSYICTYGENNICSACPGVGVSQVENIWSIKNIWQTIIVRWTTPATWPDTTSTETRWCSTLTMTSGMFSPPLSIFPQFSTTQPRGNRKTSSPGPGELTSWMQPSCLLQPVSVISLQILLTDIWGKWGNITWDTKQQLREQLHLQLYHHHFHHQLQ